MDNRPIGVFDSGIGGLTALKAIQDIMPHENVVYFGDTGRMPYGDKSKETIISYTHEIAEFLKSFGVKAILAACGTVSSYLPCISEEIFGVVKPACAAAVKTSKNKKIGILATSAAIKSESYLNELKKICSDADYFPKACPLLAPMVEHGDISFENEFLRKTLHEYITPLEKEGVDTLILGCTHYPILLPVIEKMFEGKFNLIDPGKESAKTLKKYLESNEMSAGETQNGFKKFFVSGDETEFAKSAKLFLKKDISENVKKASTSKGGDLN